MSAKQQFMVEHNFSYGWDDAGWTDDDKPWRFDSTEEAQAAIDDLISETKAEGMDGYDAADYRVVVDLGVLA